MTVAEGVALALSYLLGAIPTSYLAGRLFRGIDLRQHGSKNLGATNVYRIMGWRYAIPVGLFDVMKGAVPVLMLGPAVSSASWFPLLCGVCAVVGHVFSVFVGFKGGKGVATSAGVVLGLAPMAVGICLVVWALIVWASGYVSLGSIVAAGVFPGLVWVLYPARRETIWLYVLLAAVIIWMHRANIARLRAGTENRFGKHGKGPGAA
ncbi:MAG TPA: glycerol-3-phosphate 1-O-acyltransferase PlsY [Gemmatimonadales bacterium]|nr:glycerol-3-phosphate 1-O-acyltransferase PlsY [Gemmatimonadales bacterium]